MNAALCATIVLRWNLKLDSSWRELVYSCIKEPPDFAAALSVISFILTLEVDTTAADCPHSGGPCDGGPLGTQVRRETPPRRAVKNNRGTFSHCNPVFPGKGLWEGDRFLNNCTTLLCRSRGSQVPAAPAEQGPLYSGRGPCRAAQWSLSCINYLKYQTTRKRAVDLFVWLRWSERFLAKLWEVHAVRKRLFCTRRMCEGSWVICRLGDLSLSQFIAREIQFYAEQ